MAIVLRYGAAIIAILFALLIINYIRKNQLNLKYALVWLAMPPMMFVAILVPNFLETISNILGFEVLSNMIFLFAILLLLLICLSLTLIVSKQSNMIRLLTQEISTIKSHRNGDH